MQCATSHPFHLRYILVLSSRMGLRLSNHLKPLLLTDQNFVCMYYFPHTRYIPHQHLINCHNKMSRRVRNNLLSLLCDFVHFFFRHYVTSPRPRVQISHQHKRVTKEISCEDVNCSELRKVKMEDLSEHAYDLNLLKHGIS